jgi:hypothetical protein
MAGPLPDHVFFESAHHEIFSALISRMSAIRSAVSGSFFNLVEQVDLIGAH